MPAGACTRTTLADDAANRVTVIDGDGACAAAVANESLLDRFLAFLLGVSPHRPPPPAPPPVAEGGPVPEIVCLVDVAGRGRMKDVGLMLAANAPVSGTAVATVETVGANRGVFTRHLALDLAAGESRSVDVIRTNLAAGARLDAAITIAGRQIACD